MVPSSQHVLLLLAHRGAERGGLTVESFGVNCCWMPHGTCKLCLQKAELQRSHLVPSAMFKYTRDPNADNPNTIVVDRRTQSPVIKQVTAHLLCWNCEQRLRNCGEDWMMRQVWNGKRFPLLDRLNVAVD